MSDAAIAALLALRDCGCVSAAVTHSGFNDLKRRGLVWTGPGLNNQYRRVPHVLYRLNPRGVQLAADIF